MNGGHLGTLGMEEFQLDDRQTLGLLELRLRSKKMSLLYPRKTLAFLEIINSKSNHKSFEN